MLCIFEQRCVRRSMGRHVVGRTGSARRMGSTLLFIGALSTLLRDAVAWWPWNLPPPQEEPAPLNVTFKAGDDAGEEWYQGSGSVEDGFDREPSRSRGTPPKWNSNDCMSLWGAPELQKEADPRGYVVFSEGREQLGNNRFLLSDGLVIAKALNRTLVEFPMADSRIATPDAELGMCDYWDCEKLCPFHRILDLRTFRSFLRMGLVPVDGFLSIVSADREQTLLPGLITADNITDFFADYGEWDVIDLKMAWKSGLRREPVELLTMNPFYERLAQTLVEEQKGWENGNFLAVQWRTETSTGNLTRCYERYVLSAVEERRLSLGFGRDQVYFNTDLVGQASTTYNASVVHANRGVVNMIRADYPAAMDNTVYACLQEEQDAGVKAMISGAVSASAHFLLSSSFNGSGSNECQKPHSKYIDLIAEWRQDLLGKGSDSVGELFPSVEEEIAYLTWRNVFYGMCAASVGAAAAVLALRVAEEKRLKTT